MHTWTVVGIVSWGVPTLVGIALWTAVVGRLLSFFMY
jgi:hypothetical protein